MFAFLIGAVIGILLLSLLTGWISKKLLSTHFTSLGRPAQAGVTVGLATLVAVVLAGFGNADGGPLDYSMSGEYILAGAIVWGIKMVFRRDKKTPE